MLLPLAAVAEQEYFTWVDAEGRIHNSPKPEADHASKPEAVESVQSADVPAIGGEAYPSEDQVQKQLEQDKKDHQPFFTWVDERGIVQNQLIPQVSEAEKEVAQADAVDHMLIPPLRVKDAIRDAGCCAGYASFFVSTPEQLKPYSLTGWKKSPAFVTSSGEKRAWYVRFAASDVSGISNLQLRMRNVNTRAAMIVLDKQLKPLYFIPELHIQQHAESWVAEAYAESLVRIDDKSATAFILYFPDGAADTATLELQWWL